MIHYLIEFRFHGKAKFEIKKLIFEINNRFRLVHKREVPHITLAGPFYTNDERRLINDFNRLCFNSHLMSFKIDDFSTFKDKGVIFLDVKPGIELDEFRWTLSQELRSYCQLSQFDYERTFSFHTTIALKLPEYLFNAISDFIKTKPKLNFRHFMVRATLLKGGIILREYDFLLRKSLTRTLARDKAIYSQTINLLKEIIDH